MLRVLLSLAFLIVAISGCSRDGDESSRAKEACVVASAHIANFKRDAGRPIAVVTDVPSITPRVDELDALLMEKPRLREDPDLPLILAVAEAREISVFDQCPSLKKWLSMNGIIHDGQAIERLTRKEPWSVATLGISLPAISKDGSKALFYASEYWGSLGGGQDLLIYTKNKSGAWILQRRDGLTIS